MGGKNGKYENVPYDNFIYTGNFKNGKFHGYGELKYDSGFVLKGRFVENKKCGTFTGETKNTTSEHEYDMDRLKSRTITNKKTGNSISMKYRYAKLYSDQYTTVLGAKVSDEDVKAIIYIPEFEGKVDFGQICKWLIDPPEIAEGQPKVKLIFEGRAKIKDWKLFELESGEITIPQHYIIKCSFKNNLIDGSAEVFDIQARKKYKAEFKHGILFEEQHYPKLPLGSQSESDSQPELAPKPSAPETEEGQQTTSSE